MLKNLDAIPSLAPTSIIFILPLKFNNLTPSKSFSNIFVNLIKDLDIKYKSGRFWTDENTLDKYTDNRGILAKLLSKKTNWQDYYNTICGSSSFINGKGRDKAGKMAKLGEGIEDHLLKFNCLPSNIDKDQYYLQ